MFAAAAAAGAVIEHHDRRSGGTSVVEEVALLGLAVARIERADRGFVGMQAGLFSQSFAQAIGQLLQDNSAGAD
jgi:hypothetical protein